MRGYLGTYYEEDSLTHYGIKGMKWGVRRFQNKDGSLTNAGKNRYSEDVEKAKAKYEARKKETRKARDRYNRKTYGGILYDYEATKNLTKAESAQVSAKMDYKDSKIYDRIKDRPKTERTKKLEKRYLEQGLTEREAAVAAYKRQRAEKILIGIGAVTATAAAAYVAKKHYDNVVDKIIDPGELLHNISDKSNRGIEDAFYVAQSAGDRQKYRGMYGLQIFTSHDKLNKINKLAGMPTKKMDHVYDTAVKVGSESLKVASPKSATSVFEKLMKTDSEFRDAAKTSIGEMVANNLMWGGDGSPANTAQRKALSNISKGIFDRDAYNGFNVALVNHTTAGNEASKRFYEAMKKAGYDAVVDINDRDYSGYKARTAYVVFNGAAKVSVESVKQLGKDAVRKDRNAAMAKLTAGSLAKTGAKAVVALGTVNTIRTMRQGNLNENARSIVLKYRKEHPNSDLSYREILDMMEE